MASTRSVPIISTLLTLVQAQNSTSNETSLSQRIGWVSPPPGRSTSGIIWSCVSVLLVCSYKCVHLNIPSFKTQHAKWYEWPAIKRYLEKLGWMIGIIVAPEWIILAACNELQNARQSVKAAKAIAPQFEWSVLHGFYANMRGFGYFDTTGLTSWQTKHLLEGLPDQTSQRLSCLTLEAYATLLSKSTSPFAMFITKESIKDRSKSDAFTKLFAMIQCIWLVFGLFGRAATGLPSTQLELATAGYVVCAIVTYSLWWHKPFDINHVTIFPHTGNDAAEFTNQFHLKEWRALSSLDETGGENWTSWPSALIGLYGTATVFAAIHLIAWNWSFPSPISNLLWRVCALVATAVTPCLLFIEIIDYFQILNIDQSIVAEWLKYVGIASYIIARIGLVVLIIYSLTSMPAGVYQSVPWTEIWPHFS